MLKSKTTFALILFWISFAATAADDNEQQIWNSETGTPVVTVTIADDMVIVQSNSLVNNEENFTTQKLQSVNSLLLKEQEKDYVVIKDYLGNGFNDIGIMKGTGRGGEHPCYKVYRYLPAKGSYDAEKTLTACK